MTQFRSFLWPSNIPLYICTTTSLSIRLLMDTSNLPLSSNVYWWNFVELGRRHGFWLSGAQDVLSDSLALLPILGLKCHFISVSSFPMEQKTPSPATLVPLSGSISQHLRAEPQPSGPTG